MPCHGLAAECTLPAGERGDRERASSSCGGVAPRPPICITGLIYETRRPITHRPEGGFREAAQPNFSPFACGERCSGLAFGFPIPPVVLSRCAGLGWSGRAGLSKVGSARYGWIRNPSPEPPPARFTVSFWTVQPSSHHHLPPNLRCTTPISSPSASTERELRVLVAWARRQRTPKWRHIAPSANHSVAFGAWTPGTRALTSRRA